MFGYLAKFFVGSFIAVALTASATAVATPALAEPSCHSSDNHGGNRLGDGHHASFLLPNGAALPLGCVPGSVQHSCGDR
ncbi:hypothetical protein [Nocardia sp. CDC160]|uniref:hypothetical protein n=1 Tax=Nocardia sp. CDC160 TaxID=3112166 RepID=UPI002DB927D8|nr:hypothetical protein [Nocardia sp. CDC160]